jgi:hypothetical protein
MIQFHAFSERVNVSAIFSEYLKQGMTVISAMDQTLLD